MNWSKIVAICAVWSGASFFLLWTHFMATYGGDVPIQLVVMCVMLAIGIVVGATALTIAILRDF